MTAVEVLDLMEVHQVLVVSKDLDGEREAMEVVSPGLQGTDYSKKFPVLDIIVSFDSDE